MLWDRIHHRLFKPQNGARANGDTGGTSWFWSGVHVFFFLLLFLRLALQRRLLTGRLLNLQHRLAQRVLLHRGCRLRRQDDVLQGVRQRRYSTKVTRGVSWR